MPGITDFPTVLITVSGLWGLISRPGSVVCSTEEGQLIHKLLDHAYNKLVRPRGEGTNGTLKVKIGMRLSQLLDIVSKLKLKVGLRLTLLIGIISKLNVEIGMTYDY